jgi:hypothetical protein
MVTLPLARSISGKSCTVTVFCGSGLGLRDALASVTDRAGGLTMGVLAGSVGVSVSGFFFPQNTLYSFIF